MSKISISPEKQFDMLFKEYQLGIEHTKRYGGYAISILNIMVLGVAAILAWIVSTESVNSYLTRDIQKRSAETEII